MITKRADWDVIIIGAGVAGAVMAWQLARKNLAVLLVDRSAFPRYKVCGCCLSGRAVAALTALGLQDLHRCAGAQTLSTFSLASSGRQLKIDIPAGIGISRSKLDMQLVEKARQAGTVFLDRTTAMSSELTDAGRCLQLRQHGKVISLNAKLIIAADGLAGSFSARQPGIPPYISSNSSVGAGAILNATGLDYQPGCIYMRHARGGYVGLARIEDDQLAVAAALKPQFLRQAGHPGDAVAQILAEAAGEWLPDISKISWQGTPALTRKRPTLADERLFFFGDAAGYVEPFTGEGMAWAIESAAALTPIACEAAKDWRAEYVTHWQQAAQRATSGAKWRCRLMTLGLRSPILTHLAMHVLERGILPARLITRYLQPANDKLAYHDETLLKMRTIS